MTNTKKHPKHCMDNSYCKLKKGMSMKDLRDRSWFNQHFEFSMRDLCSRLDYYELLTGMEYKFGAAGHVLVYCTKDVYSKSLLMYDIDEFFYLFEDA